MLDEAVAGRRHALYVLKHRVFCIVRRWPADGRLPVPIDRRPRAARQLEGPQAIPASMVDGHLVVDLSGVHPTDPRASVIELTFDRSRAEGPTRQVPR